MNLERIQHLQNRIARVILNNFDFVNTRGIDLVCKLGIMTVKQRRDYFMALLMYKSIHGLAPNYLCNEITMEIEVANRTSRHINENDAHVPMLNWKLPNIVYRVKDQIYGTNCQSLLKNVQV